MLHATILSRDVVNDPAHIGRHASKAVRVDGRSLLVGVRYAIELDLLEVGRGATSRTEIRFGCTKPGTVTYADLALARVTTLELNGVPLESSSWAGRRLELPPLAPQNVLVVEGEAVYSSGRDGLCTFVDDGGDRFVYLHLPARAPETAAEVMCCFVDAPRATFDLAVVVPAGWSVVSHAPPVERPEPGAAGRWRFVSPLAMEARPTFAAGPWAMDRDVYVRPSIEPLLERSPIGDLRDAVVDAHERLLGTVEPFGQLPCVLVPGYGSQASNAGGLMMCHERVLHGSVDDEWRAYVLWVLAHEAAHSWFGAVFERERPEDHWLYEGIATYLCHRAMEELAPELSPWARYHLLEEAEAHALDVGAEAHAIAALPASSPARATRGLPPLVYGKPAAILRHVERIIGRDAVDAALHVLLRDHEGGVACTADFVDVVETAAGRDMKQWAEDWLYTEGVNTLTLDVDHALVHQTPSRDGRLRTHHITVSSFDLVEGSLVARPPVDVAIIGAVTAVPTLVEVPHPDVVVLNAPAASYVRVRLDERSRSTLKTHLGALPSDVRAVCWVALREMVTDGLVQSSELQEWSAAHAHIEPDPQVRTMLTT